MQSRFLGHTFLPSTHTHINLERKYNYCQLQIMRRVVHFMVLKLPRGASEEVGEDLAVVNQVRVRSRDFRQKSNPNKRMFQERREQRYTGPSTLV